MKKPSCKVGAAVFASLTLLSVCAARAVDSAPPCWRGTPGTTYEDWSFAASNNPATPDAFTNVNGTPSATLTQGSFATGWKASALGKTGVWDLGQAGQVSLTVPNFGGSPASWKYVQVQVTYFDAPGFYLPPTTSIAGATLVSSQVISNNVFGPGVWRTQVTLWLIQPSPGSETILLTGAPTKGLVIEEILIDTRSSASGDGDFAGFRPCWRGQTNTTFQHWMFGVSNNPAAIPAELVTNIYGVPLGSMVAGPFSSGYIESDPFLGCRQGIWDLGRFGTMSFGISNTPWGPVGSYKYVRVQVTQYRDTLYDTNASVAIAGGTLVGEQQQVIETTGFGGQWVVDQTTWKLGPPCPGAETVVLTAGTNGSLIDQVVVDTICLSFASACPGDIVTSTDPGQCSKSNVTYALPAVNGCTVTNVTSTPPSGSTFPKGTNLVTSVIQDGEGASTVCQFNVIVNDTEAPTVVCPANMTVYRDPLQCGTFVTFAATPSDNCPGATVTCVPASGSLFPLGLTAVTCTAHDTSSNNSTPCSFSVQVVDITGDLAAFRPCWRGQTNTTFQQWAFSVSNNPAAIPAELVTNIYGVPLGSMVAGPFSSGYIESDPFLGCRQGIWDLGRFGTMSFGISNTPWGPVGSYKYVRVQVTQYRDTLYDTNASVAIAGGTLVGEQQQVIETTGFGGQWVVDQTTWKLGPPCPGAETVVLTAGTNGSLIDQVVVDTICLNFAPACPGDIVTSADPGQCSKSNVTYALPAVNGCTVTNVTSTPPSGSTFPKGTNLVTSVIQDGEGASTVCQFNVIVNDTEAPTVVCPANMTVYRDPLQCGTFVTFAATPSDNCPGATVTCVPASGSLFPLGLTAVTCTAHDTSSNNSTPCSFSVQVVDITGDLAAFRPCWRGQTNTTFQQWAFSVSNNPAAIPAELVTNVYGVPLGSMVAGPFSSGYIESDPFLGCRQGIWDLGRFGTMSFGISNTPWGPVGSYKYVRVQVTQYRDTLYDTNATVAIAGGTLVGEQQQVIETTGFGGQWVVDQTTWKLGPPCPGAETVVLTAGTNGSLIDQVVVDTICLNFAPACPGDIVTSADPGQCSKSNVTYALPAVNGCTITNIVSTPPDGSTFPVGTNLVTSLIIDAEGGTNTCMFYVKVTDNEFPVASCTNITVNLDVNGLVTITGADVDNGSSDNCGIASRVVSPNTFTCTNIGPNNVLLTVTDVHSNSATCNAIVTVQDNLPPTITCPTNIIVANDANDCGAIVNFVLPAGSDNCGVASVVAIPPSGSHFPVGSNAVLVVITDVNANSNSCTFAVIVNDTQPPTITCPPNLTDVPTAEGVCYATNVSLGVPIATNDNCGILVVSNNAPTQFPHGNTTVTWTVVDTSGNSATCAQLITVNDHEQPAITCPTNIVAHTSDDGTGNCSTTVSITPATATDNCDSPGAITITGTRNDFLALTNPYPKGVTTIAWTAVDTSSNQITCFQTVTVLDDEQPAITCPTNIVAHTSDDGIGNCSTTVSITPATATDNCDSPGAITITGTRSDFLALTNPYPKGVTMIAWTAVDTSSNQITCFQTVTVLDDEQPTIFCPGSIVANTSDDGTGNCSTTVAITPATATDNCDAPGAITITGTRNDFLSLTNPYPKGVTIIAWTAIDTSSNQITCFQTVKVVDDENPTITCPGNVVTNATVACSQVVVWPAPITNDNCAVASLICVPPSGSTFFVGVSNVTCTVMDSSGNSNTCSFTVTVLAEADLSIQISASPAAVTVGDNVSYTVTVSNAGPCAAVGVVVSNQFSAGQIAISVTNGATGQGCPFPGPVAWWRAEGNASDSADGNNGAAAGGVTYSAGEVGQNFVFDGTSGNVAVPDAPGLRPASLTIEGWIRIDDVTGVHVIIGKRVGGATLDSYSMWVASGVLYAAIANNSGSGPFLSYPELPTSSLFVASDLVDLQSFAFALQPAVPADLVSQFLKANLSPATAALLAGYGGGPNPALQSALIGDLNQIIQAGSIYTVPRFSAVTLSPETIYVLGRSPSGEDLVRLNRLLVRDAYPSYFATVVFPQLTQRYHVAYNYDAVSQVQALYVNGALVNASLVTNVLGYDAHQLYIGADDNSGSPGFFYKGEIDELTLYNRALTGTEIRAIYDADGNGKCLTPGASPLGTLATGATTNFTLGAVATGCGNLSASATVSSTTPDPNLVNNSATSSPLISVSELPLNQLIITIQPVSINNHLLRLAWPLTCSPYTLLYASNLNFPINWNTAIVPMQMINNLNSTIVPADQNMRYFRVRLP